MSLSRFLTSTLVLATCVSCGKIRDALDALDFKDVGEANFAIRDRFKDMPGTIPAALPTGSTADFSGAARILLIRFWQPLQTTS